MSTADQAPQLKLGWEEWVSLPELGLPALRASFGELEAWMRDLVARGQASGQLRTDLPHGLLFAVVMGLGEAIDVWTLQQFERGEAPFQADTLDPFVDQMVDLWRRVLEP